MLIELTLCKELERKANELLVTLNLEITVVVLDEELLNAQGAQLMGYLSEDVITVSLPSLHESSSIRGYDIEVALILTLSHEIGHYLCEHETVGSYTVIELIIMELEAWQTGVQIIHIVQDLLDYKVELLPLYDSINLDNIEEYCSFYAKYDENVEKLYSRIRNSYVHGASIN